MNCPQCSTQMVRAKATNFGPEYDYCRPCGKELAEMQQKPTPKNKDFVATLKDYYAGLDWSGSVSLSPNTIALAPKPTPPSAPPPVHNFVIGDLVTYVGSIDAFRGDTYVVTSVDVHPVTGAMLVVGVEDPARPGRKYYWCPKDLTLA
jgi:hypothetical protein